jgi:methionine aminopeptidase
MYLLHLNIQTIFVYPSFFKLLCCFFLLGIAFPCCISVNNCICHFSPLSSDADVVVKEGDMVKIDLGAHIDGFIAVVAHTVVAGKDKITGRQADVMLAAHLASEAALRLVKPGNEVCTKLKFEAGWPMF